MIAIAITRVVLRLIFLIAHNSAKRMAIHTTAVVWGRRYRKNTMTKISKNGLRETLDEFSLE